MDSSEQIARVAGLRLVQIGDVWAAFSPKSGETLLTNDTSAAILEVLDGGSATIEQVVHQLAADAGVEARAVRDAIEAGWSGLIEAGLVENVSPSSEAPRIR